MAGTDDHLQNHDVQVIIKGANIPVYVDDDLASGSGWRGGQFVIYTSNTVGTGPAFSKNIRVVGASEGDFSAGFLLRGSEFHPNVQTPGGRDLRTSEYNYSSYQPRDTRVVTLVIDGSHVFKIYEKFEFPTRGSGTALTYTLNQSLYVSERGLITTLVDATAAGISSPVFVGNVWMIPSTDNENRLGVEKF